MTRTLALAALLGGATLITACERKGYDINTDDDDGADGNDAGDGAGGTDPGGDGGGGGGLVSPSLTLTCPARERRRRPVGRRAG